jgi:hypothetical protein
MLCNVSNIKIAYFTVFENLMRAYILILLLNLVVLTSSGQSNQLDSMIRLADTVYLMSHVLTKEYAIKKEPIPGKVNKVQDLPP